MQTERYDLAIPLVEGYDFKAALQKACDENDEYPIRISSNKNGYVVSFLRNPKCPRFQYMNSMQNVINTLKLELALTTIIMQKKIGNICEKTLSSLDERKIKEIKKTKDIIESNKESSELSKKLEEDSEYFNSFTNKQILTSDYDTKDGRMADRHALKVLKQKGKFFVLSDETGQLSFDMTRY